MSLEEVPPEEPEEEPEPVLAGLFELEVVVEVAFWGCFEDECFEGVGSGDLVTTGVVVVRTFCVEVDWTVDCVTEIELDTKPASVLVSSSSVLIVSLDGAGDGVEVEDATEISETDEGALPTAPATPDADPELIVDNPQAWAM